MRDARTEIPLTEKTQADGGDACPTDPSETDARVYSTVGHCGAVLVGVVGRYVLPLIT